MGRFISGSNKEGVCGQKEKGGCEQEIQVESMELGVREWGKWVLLCVL